MNRKVREIAWLFLFFCIIMAIFSAHFIPTKYPISEGKIAASTIKAPQTITFEDAKKTAERKKQAEDAVGDVYVLDQFVLPKLEEEITQVFQDFSRVITNNNMDSREKINTLIKDYGLSDVAATVFITIESDTVRILRSEAINLLRTNWQTGVKGLEVEEKREKILAQIELLNYNAPYRELIKAVFKQLELYPNYAVSETETLKAKQAASKDERPVLVTIQKGQKIVGEGEVVTTEQIDILRVLGYQRTSAPYRSLSGISLFLLLCVFLTGLFLKQYRRDLYRKENNLVLMGLLFSLTLLIAKLIVTINISPMPEIDNLVGYLVPISTGSMLLTILLDTRLAVFLTIILSFLVGILTENQLSYAIVAFIGGLVGIFSVSRFSQRMDWARAGLLIALANVICILSLDLLNNSGLKEVAIGVLLGAVNGLFSAVFAYGSLPFLESGFKVTTSVRLLELSNPNQPLLRRLLIEAPGTYHHSVLVGNLAEAAADAIGADALLARVGAYYHDIGKLKRPYFFIENQMGGDNPHEQLTPALNTLIITSHVKDGLELARQYAVPTVIMDLIAQHHGTSLVTYFYHKAQEAGNADTVKENDFRYNAPKPQSKEAAIIMLADSVEAAVRSMPDPTSGKIEGMVRKIIKERLQDGQLDESELTFRDTDVISTAFFRILGGIFHTRIEYPENVLEAMKGGLLPDGDNHQQPAEKSAGSSTDKGIGS